MPLALQDRRGGLEWSSFLQALLGATGIFAATIYAIGWLYWFGYFGYYSVPLGAVDLSVADFVAASAPEFWPILGVIVMLPFLLLVEWRYREAQPQMEALHSDWTALTGLASELKKRAEEAEEPEERSKIEKELAALEQMLAEINSKVDEQRSRLRVFPGPADAVMERAPEFLKKHRLALWVPAAIFPVLLMFLTFYSIDGLESAGARAGIMAVTVVITIVAIELAIEVISTKEISRVLVSLAVLLLFLVPLSAWLDGRLTGYSEWHADQRPDRFQAVILYSTAQLYDDWEEHGDVFVSPELLLIRKAGDTYVVIDERSPDRATIISSTVITHADYAR